MAQTVDIDMSPGYHGMQEAFASQYDNGRKITLNIRDRLGTDADLTGMTARIEGIKPDGTGFQYDAEISGSSVEVKTTDQMTAVAGDVICEIIFTKGTERVGTANFVLSVEKAALSSDDLVSETDLPLIIQVSKDIKIAQEAAYTATSEAGKAADSASAAAQSEAGAAASQKAAEDSARSASDSAAEAAESKQAVSTWLVSIKDTLGDDDAAALVATAIDHEDRLSEIERMCLKNDFYCPITDDDGVPLADDDGMILLGDWKYDYL